MCLENFGGQRKENWLILSESYNMQNKVNTYSTSGFGIFGVTHGVGLSFVFTELLVLTRAGLETGKCYELTRRFNYMLHHWLMMYTLGLYIVIWNEAELEMAFNFLHFRRRTWFSSKHGAIDSFIFNNFFFSNFVNFCLIFPLGNWRFEILTARFTRMFLVANLGFSKN